MKLLQRDLKQEQSYDIVQAKSQKQSVIQTILHLGPSVILCSSLLQLFCLCRTPELAMVFLKVYTSYRVNVPVIFRLQKPALG